MDKDLRRLRNKESAERSRLKKIAMIEELNQKARENELAMDRIAYESANLENMLRQHGAPLPYYEKVVTFSRNNASQLLSVLEPAVFYDI